MFVLVDNLKINYFKENNQNKKTLILLHGWKNDLEIWKPIISSLKDYRIICLDLPGFGKSDLPRGAWGVLNYAKFLNQFLEKLNISKTVLIGHSFGGRIAIKFASLYSAKVDKLILIDSGGIRPQKNFKNFLYFILSKVGGTVFSLPGLKNFKEKIRNQFYQKIEAVDYLNIENPILKTSFLKIINEDLRKDAQKIKNKTLVIWGEKDKETPLKDAFIFHKFINNSRLAIIEEAGHFPFLDNKKEFLRILMNFI